MQKPKIAFWIFFSSLFFEHKQKSPKTCLITQTYKTKMWLQNWLILYSGVCLIHRAEHKGGANSGVRIAGGKLSIRRRRKANKQEWVTR